jgi:hypothetical protein
MDLNLLWFGLLGVLLSGYAILDGFDLGVGMLHLRARTDTERRIFMNSIGPLWDGNEVWLVTFGGALFAAFPHAYATAFSGFYTPFIVLLFALIFRAVSMEFRSKRESAAWRRAFDIGFFASSALATFLFGVAVGNSMLGLPIGPDMEFQGGPQDRGRAAGTDLWLDAEDVFRVPRRVRRRHGGDSARHSPRVRQLQPLPVGGSDRDPQRSRNRQHPESHSPGTAALRVRLVIRDHRGAGVPLRDGASRFTMRRRLRRRSVSCGRSRSSGCRSS